MPDGIVYSMAPFTQDRLRRAFAHPLYGICSLEGDPIFDLPERLRGPALSTLSSATRIRAWPPMAWT